MSFVNELIPESEKEKFPFPVDTRPGGGKPTLWKWTIDRERNAVLVHTGGGGGGHQGTQRMDFYVLSWSGSLIDISASRLPSKRVEKGVVMSWRINKLDIPPVLQSRQEELFQLIKESFAAMGDIYDGEQYVAVNVDFYFPPSR